MKYYFTDCLCNNHNLFLQACRIHQKAMQTGGSGEGLEILTPMEDRIVAIMGKTAYEGNESTIISFFGSLH